MGITVEQVRLERTMPEAPDLQSSGVTNFPTTPKRSDAALICCTYLTLMVRPVRVQRGSCLIIYTARGLLLAVYSLRNVGAG